ncbi:MAG: hypothetical protein L0Z55_12825 [Planctomycetes bacterium]|nr:hypothetical protein [Planctomycetota bacterium]
MTTSRAPCHKRTRFVDFRASREAAASRSNACHHRLPIAAPADVAVA